MKEKSSPNRKLEEDIEDLRTRNKMLESENQRLKDLLHKVMERFPAPIFD
jgi:hypothetical protein